MSHYIDEQENVLVMPFGCEPEEEGYYLIPDIGRGFMANVMGKVGLFAFSKAFQTLGSHPNLTTSEATYKRLNEMGFNVNNDYNMPNLPPQYKWYAYLNLWTLYNANNHNINIHKPFIISKEYIQDITAKYDHDKVMKFTNILESGGYISFEHSK